MKNIDTFMEALGALRSTVYGIERKSYMDHIARERLPIVGGVYDYGKRPYKFHNEYSTVRADIPRTTFSDGFECQEKGFGELLAHILYPMVEFRGYIQGMSNMCGTILRMHLERSGSFEDTKEKIEEVAGDCYMVLCKFVIPYSIDDPCFETAIEYASKTNIIARALFPDLFRDEEAAMTTFHVGRYLDGALRWFSAEHSFHNTVKIFNHLISHEGYQPFLFFMATRGHAARGVSGTETDGEQSTRVNRTIAICEVYASQLGRFFAPWWTADGIDAHIKELQKTGTPLLSHCEPHDGCSDCTSGMPPFPLDWSTIDTSEVESLKMQRSESTWCDLGAETSCAESTWCDLEAEASCENPRRFAIPAC